MWMILLYGVATFMETGVGVWMFGRMFPEQDEGNRVYIRILYALLLLTTYTFSDAYFSLNNFCKLFFCTMVIAFILNDIVLHRKKGRYKDKYIVIERNLVFAYMVILITWQYWTSYLSIYYIWTGNLYIVFFLCGFFKCKWVQAYLWETLWLINVGLLKMLYIVASSFARHKEIIEYVNNYRYKIHSYNDAIYLMGICGIILMLQYMFYVTSWMKELLKNYSKYLVLVLISESALLWMFMDINHGQLRYKDLIEALLLTIGVTFILLSLSIHFLVQNMMFQKRILEVKNKTIIQQYKELNENFQRYRYLIHDEKYILKYIISCIERGKINEVVEVVEKQKEKLTEKYYWTGIEIIDSIITLEKRKMDDLCIEFELISDISNCFIEEIDMVILLENLFDNAIEASGQSEGKRKILLNIKNVNETFILKMWNNSNKLPIMKGEKFLTDKKDVKGHGWGIESVKYTVKKYNGEIEFKYDDDFFEVIIII
jgi:hypothetical protein